MNPKISLRPEIQDFGPGGPVVTLIHQDRVSWPVTHVGRNEDGFLDPEQESVEWLEPEPTTGGVPDHIFGLQSRGILPSDMGDFHLVQPKPSFWSRLKTGFLAAMKVYGYAIALGFSLGYLGTSLLEAVIIVVALVLLVNWKCGELDRWCRVPTEEE